MKIEILLTFVVVLLNLNGTFAKNKVPGCTGNKQDVCNVLKERNNELETCQEDKSELQDELAALKKTLDNLEKQNKDLESENEDLTNENQELKEENEDLKKENEGRKKNGQNLKNTIDYLEQKIDDLEQELDKFKPEPTQPPAPKSCFELLVSGKTTSGIYTIDPDGQGAFEVYCDQQSQRGGWAIIQRRKDGSVDFSRGWEDYKVGFGKLGGEWWLGLDKIHRITLGQRNDLRIGLIDWGDKSAQAVYSGFSVGAESTQYELSSGTFVGGTAGDSMSYHNGRKFSTSDHVDRDVGNTNCAVTLSGGWWYSGDMGKCADANLNGQYGKNLFYRSWKGEYSLKKTAMRVRPSLP